MFLSSSQVGPAKVGRVHKVILEVKARLPGCLQEAVRDAANALSPLLLGLTVPCEISRPDNADQGTSLGQW